MARPAAIDPSLSPLADLVQPGGRLVPPDQAADAAPTPLTLDIPTIRVQGAPIRPVGVLDNGELEVPGGREVGWYRWSASPGRSGSAVLAAHIAYNGSDGVFRRLDQLEPGDEITVRYEDGDEGRFVVSEKAQYAKDELPADRVFAREGSPLLTLITCGGSFNPDLRSYDDNVVVYAIPV